MGTEIPVEERVRAALDELTLSAGFGVENRGPALSRRTDEQQSLLTLVKSADSRRRHRRRVLMTTLGGLAAATLTVAGVAMSVTSSNQPAYAASFLRSTAQVALHQPGGWPDSRFWYVMFNSVTYGPDGRALDPLRTYQVWIGHDGTRLTRGSGIPGPPDARAGTSPSAEAVGHGIGPDHSGISGFGSAAFTWDQLYALPTEPAALLARLKSMSASTNQDIFSLVVQLLAQTPVSPALRSALFDAAAQIPGARLLGPTTDAMQRSGVAVKRDISSGGYVEAIVDPRTGALFETRVAAPTSSGWPATTSVETYLAEGPATAAGVVPADAAGM